MPAISTMTTTSGRGRMPLTIDSNSAATLAGPVVHGDLTAPRSEASARGELATLMRRYRWRIASTYALFNVENLLRLAQPLCLGLAINGLLEHSYLGLAIFAAAHLGHMAIRLVRQMFDTRTFSAIYTERASELVLAQRGRNVDASRVTARSAMSRQFVDFLERHVPTMVRSLYSVVGALVMLAWYDAAFLAGCAVLAVPACLLNFIYGRQSLRLNHLLHNDLEREVGVVSRANRNEVHNHYQRLARWRIRLSDWEALTTGVMELFVLALMAAALLRVCTLPSVGAGDIYAVFRYVLMFVMGLDSLPMLVQQVSRLRDIARRIAA